jgi:hypothetical protein
LYKCWKYSENAMKNDGKVLTLNRVNNAQRMHARFLLPAIVACLGIVAPFASGLAQNGTDWSPTSGIAPGVQLATDAEFRVHADRPRLYFRPADIPALKQRAAGPLAAQYKRLSEMAAVAAAKDPAGNQATTNLTNYGGDSSQAVAFIGLLEGDQAYINWAIKWAKAIAAMPVPSDDTGVSSRIRRMSVVYDWLYNRMSATDRQVLRQGLIKYVNALMKFGSMNSPIYSGGHGRSMHGNLAMALIALDGDYTAPDNLLYVLRNRLKDKLNPMQSWIATDGGYHMGWLYTASYANFDSPYLIWSVGTNDLLLDDWLAKTASWYVYGLRGNGTLPTAGDAARNRIVSGAKSTIYAAGVGKDPIAKWYLDKLGPSSEPFYQLLLLDPNVKAQAPDSLPPSKYFANAGVVIARDNWGADSTQLVFKSTSFSTRNHQHRDQNSFTLFFREPLALDSGIYDKYTSSHSCNYYTRTIAHNAIVVFDPNQKFSLGGCGNTSNDGGQLFAAEAKTLEELLPGGSKHLDGIVRYQEATDFSYAWGDATKAYDTSRVTQAQREIVFIRDPALPHPAVLVFDRVRASSPSFEKRFLLHTVNQPSINGRVAVANTGSARLTSMTLYPADARLARVGGPGKEYLVAGVNYPPVNVPRDTPTEEAGNWRLEVSPGAGRQQDYFLHALFVDDANVAPVPANQAVLIESGNALGAWVGNRAFVFPRNPVDVTTVSYTAGKDGLFKHTVTGFIPSADVTVSLNGVPQQTIKAGAGGLVEFEVATQANDTVAVLMGPAVDWPPESPSGVTVN